MNIILYLKNKANRKGKYPITLLIRKDNKQKMIFLGYYCLKKEWNAKREEFKSNYPNYKTANQVLLRKKSEALEIVDRLELQDKPWELSEFERKFKNIGRKPPTVLEMFDMHIQDFEDMNKLSTAKSYKDVKRSFFNYASKDLTFEELDGTLIEKYINHLRKTYTDGGINYVLRHLRTIVNKARKRKIIPKEPYCFENIKVSKFKSQHVKEILTFEELKRFRELDLSKHPELIEAYDYFLFSVGTRGMNFKDMMNLKWDNIKNNRIKFIRGKTKKNFDIKIIPMVREILDKYHNNSESDYVFPILKSNSLTAKQIENRHHKVLSRYNKKLKKLAELADIDKNLTSYVARHTFASILKYKGESISVISELMGHSDINVTKSYLRDFDTKTLDEATEIFNKL